MNNRDLITGLDACRPASDDLRQPELRAVAGHVRSDDQADTIRVHIERIDLAVSRTMHDVPLPAEFAERLVARLRDAAQQAAIGDAVGADLSPAPVAPAHSQVGASHSQRQYSRRRWLAWSAGLASAAAAVIAGVILLRPAKPLETGDLEASRQWHDQIVSADNWQTFDPNQLDEHALPSELRNFPRRYRDVSSIVGRDARAYDVTLPGGPSATLFVIPQSERAGITSSAPTARQSYTLGRSVAYWQSGGVIYVLVIESDQRKDYRMLLRATASDTA